MYQSFDETADGSKGPERLAALRGQMVAEGLAGFFVPRADAHQGEYVADCDARLAWLTGFTGSAGFCIALADHAGVFVDGRYRLQVRAQVAPVFTPVDWPEIQPGPWLRDTLGSGTVGYDPWLHTVDEIARIEAALAGSEIALRPVANLVDRIWANRPPAPASRIEAYPDALAGRTSAEKRSGCAQDLRAAGQDAAVLTQPDGICWLLNIRGDDIPRVPAVLSFAVLHSDASVDLFVDPARLGHLDLGDGVRAHHPDRFTDVLAMLTGKVRIDPKTGPIALVQALSAAEPVHGADPCTLPKARKTEAEIAGTREAHLRDGAAVTEFLCWLDAQPPASLTEIDVVTALEGFRQSDNAFRGPSFDTICGSGPNGAIMHYRVTHNTSRRLAEGELMVVDSGGQYLDGTTDITRTIGLGTVGDEERAAYTRVLQGMIGISRLRWPKGLAGHDLDAVARIPLWQAGMDFAHGTGHGVGHYMSVHEGPQRLSRISDVPLDPGMILSNEPGFYRDGRYGIRIENLIVVRQAPELPGATVGTLLEFETLTFVPLDRRLIVDQMLTGPERDWIDAYHAEVAEKLHPRLSDVARAWLGWACAPL